MIVVGNSAGGNVLLVSGQAGGFPRAGEVSALIAAVFSQGEVTEDLMAPVA